MLTRRHVDGETVSEALYSPCETYRYALTRVWRQDGGRLLFVMLNPSRATELANDPTVERCERRARALGFGAFRVANLFALRETDPHAMRRHPEPDGPENDAVLRESADWADTILAAWGVHGVHRDGGGRVARLLAETGKPLHAMGVTRDGHPRHPLYVGYAVEPRIWEGYP